MQRYLVMFGYLCEHSKKCQTAYQQLWMAQEAVSPSPNDSNAVAPALDHNTKKKLIAIIEQTAKKSILDISVFDPRILYGAAYSAASFALSAKDEKIQSRAVQTLCGIFAGYPRIMLLAQSTGLMNRILSKKAEFSPLIH
jgi:hypothetical protein